MSYDGMIYPASVKSTLEALFTEIGWELLAPHAVDDDQCYRVAMNAVRNWEARL